MIREDVDQTFKNGKLVKEERVVREIPDPLEKIEDLKQRIVDLESEIVSLTKSIRAENA